MNISINKFLRVFLQFFFANILFYLIIENKECGAEKLSCLINFKLFLILAFFDKLFHDIEWIGLDLDSMSLVLFSQTNSL